MMEGYADIEGPVWLWLLGWREFLLAAGLLCLAALAVVLFRRHRRRRAAAPPPPGPSPLARALERLGLLRSSAGGLAAEPFTVEVSDIVRDYLEAVLAIPAREQTSEEFLTALQARADSPAILREHMPAFLEHCDRVKFARQELASGQRDALLDTAQNVIERTA